MASGAAGFAVLLHAGTAESGPVAAIGVIVLLYLEAGHQALPNLNIPRMNMEGFITGESAEDEASGPSLLELLMAAPAAEGILTEGLPSDDPPAEEAAVTEENSPDHSPAAKNPDGKTNEEDLHP